MSEYRVYVIGSDGRFIRAVRLECPDDTVAIESAKQLVNGHDVELWQHDRQVAKFESKPE